jgi:hypothetical protein
VVSLGLSWPHFHILTGSVLAGNLVWAHEEAKQLFNGLADIVVRVFLIDREL